MQLCKVFSITDELRIVITLLLNAKIQRAVLRKYGIGELAKKESSGSFAWASQRQVAL